MNNTPNPQHVRDLIKAHNRNVQNRRVWEAIEAALAVILAALAVAWMIKH